MSAVMEEEIKRWTARRKSALVLEIIQGKTTGPVGSSICGRPRSRNGSSRPRQAWRTRCVPSPKTCDLRTNFVANQAVSPD